MRVEYKEEPDLAADEFLDLAQRVWPRNYNMELTITALGHTVNITARANGHLIGSIRILTDGYLFGTIPEIMVDPAHQRQGIGRRLMELAWQRSPTSLFLGAQPGNEAFFEKLGFTRGMQAYTRRKARPEGQTSASPEQRPITG